MANYQDLFTGSSPQAVLASDVRRAAEEGFSLTTDPQTVTVDGSRCVYWTSPESGSTSLVAVLPAGKPFGKRVAMRIAASLRRDARRMRASDLCTVVDLAERMIAAENTLRRWKEIPSFPKPVKILLGRIPLYDLAEVRRWEVAREAFHPRSAKARKG